MTVLTRIPLTTHHNLSLAIRGRVIATELHGDDVDVLLEGNRGISLSFAEARALWQAIAPNRQGRVVIYDGHSIVVGED